MFDREYSREKPLGTRRLVVIGDSISVGEFGANYETLLEDQLNRNHRTPAISRFEVLNLAVEGYRITHLVGVAWQRAPMFQPDVYLVTLTRLSVARRWSYHIGQLVRDGVDLQYDFLRRVTAEAGVRPTDSLSRIDRKLARFHEPVLDWSIAQLQTAAAANKARLVVLLMPWTIADPTIDAQFERARQQLAALRIPVIDLRDSFAGVTDLRQLRVGREDYHPNTRGHQIMADKLYHRILADPAISEAILGYLPGKS
jgi:lysophospholipase L1-like esterase